MIDRQLLLLLAFLNFIVISLCLSVIVSDRFRESGYERQISSVKNTRDSLLRINSELILRGRLMEQKAQGLQDKINQSSKTIQNLKTKQHEKINQLDTMYVDGLVRFFTNFQTAYSTRQ